MPLHLMSRQTLVGCLFLVVGLALVALAVTPVIIGLLSIPRAHGDVSIAFLAIGVVVAVFGAWLLPSSGAPAAATQMIAVVGPLMPRIPGLSRVGDPPAVPPTSPLSPPEPTTPTRATAPPTVPNEP